MTPAPDTPLAKHPSCLPVDAPSSRSPKYLPEDDTDNPVVVDDHSMGASVTYARFGSYQTPDFFTEVVVGSPDSPASGGNTGIVRWLGIDDADGQLNGDVETREGSGSAIVGLGEVVVAGDIHSPYVPTFATSTWRLGDEVLVGAPSSEGDIGRVYVFATKVPTAAIGTDRAAWEWEQEQEIAGTTATGARFGAAIAVPPDTDPQNRAEWVAIGAPGENTVYIYERDTSAIKPVLSVLQIIRASDVGLAGATNFGSALVVDDFDLDGELDLAVGAPASGDVVVIRGQSSSTAPLDTATVLTPANPLISGSEFGYALASGLTYGGTSQPDGTNPIGLAIGAPGTGQVCVVGIDSTFNLTNPATGDSSTTCSAGSSSPQRLGETVAVANVAPMDAFMDDGSREARVEEIVAGAPSSDEIVWEDTDADGLWDATSGAAGVGTVVIFRGLDVTGPVFPSMSGTPETSLPYDELLLRPAVTSGGTSAFGSALLPADLQKTGKIDLLVGAPDHPFTSDTSFQGAVQILNTSPVHGLSTNDGGLFSGVDSNDAIANLTAVQSDGLYLKTQTDFSLLFTKPDGSGGEEACRAGGKDAGGAFPVQISIPHTLGGVDSQFVFMVDLRTNEIINELPPYSEFKLGDIMEVTLDVSDTGFGDTNPNNDVITFDFSQIRVHSGSGATDWYASDKVIDKDCTIKNGPDFDFTRTSTFGDPCE